MAESIFSQTAPASVSRGYSPLPIMPNSKAPGVRNINGEWQPMSRWQRWCKEQPTEHTLDAWLRMIADDNAGVGVACGLGLICIDIDFEECMAPLLAILPISHVQKKGKKGVSLFYRGNTDVIRSRNFRTPDKIGLVDLLAEGKQTVLPPSIHPDTGEPYYWWTDDTLMDTRLEDLTELPNDIADRIAEVLKQFGYDPEGDRKYEAPIDTPARSTIDARNLWRETSEKALAHLSTWVPALCLYRCRTKAGGYCAVATWRESSTGRSREVRKRNLSIVSKGIEDFGDGRKYRAIDLVIAARNCDPNAALNWLLSHLPQEPMIILRNRKQ